MNRPTLTLGFALVLAGCSSLPSEPTQAPVATIAPTGEVGTALTGTPTPEITVTPEPTPAATPTPAPAKAIVLKGTGSRKTKPFILTSDSGNYTVTFKGTATGYTNASVELYTLDNPSFGGYVDLLFNELRDRGKYTYDTEAYGIVPGRYYINVSMDGSWVVTFTPQP